MALAAYLEISASWFKQFRSGLDQSKKKQGYL